METTGLVLSSPLKHGDVPPPPQPSSCCCGIALAAHLQLAPCYETQTFARGFSLPDLPQDYDVTPGLTSPVHGLHSPSLCLFAIFTKSIFPNFSDRSMQVACLHHCVLKFVSRSSYGHGNWWWIQSPAAFATPLQPIPTSDHSPWTTPAHESCQSLSLSVCHVVIGCRDHFLIRVIFSSRSKGF